MQGYEVQQSSTSYPLVFLLISSTDHISPVTGATPTVVISKGGGAFAAPSGAVTEIGDGWYHVAGNATDTGSLGPLILHATATGADPTDMLFAVVAVNPQSGTNYGLSALPAANPGALGGLPTANAAGNVGADLRTILGTASAGAAGFVGIDWAHVNSPTTAVALSNTTISTSQAIASVSGAVGSVAAVVSADVTQWLGTQPPTPGVAGVPVVDVRYIDGDATAATALGGTTTTIILAANEPQNISYAGQYVSILSGTGANQSRYVLSSAVVSSQLVLTVIPPWDIAPDTTSVYQLGGFGLVTVAGYSSAGSVPTPRDITAIADSALTPADVAWASLALVGRQDASSGTSLIFSSPGGATLRTSPVTTAATNPYGSSFPVKRT